MKSEHYFFFVKIVKKTTNEPSHDNKLNKT